MARSLSDALRMARAAEAEGITLVVNWPVAWSPAERLAKDLIDAGEIGRVLEVKWRGGHTGPLGPGATHEGIEQEAELDADLAGHDPVEHVDGDLCCRDERVFRHVGGAGHRSGDVCAEARHVGLTAQARHVDDVAAPSLAHRGSNLGSSARHGMQKGLKRMTLLSPFAVVV